MKNIRVSFVIPVYNAEQYIGECVKSIAKQDNGCIEIILVDDGSTDNSYEICCELSEQFPGLITVIHQENQGSFPARMNGASNANGDYIFFADADDYIESGAITRIFEDIVSDSDIFIYDYIEEYNDGREEKTISALSLDETKTYSSEERKAVTTVFMGGMINTVWATGIKKKLLENLPKFQLDIIIKNGEDRLMKMFLLLAAETVTFVPYAFYHCRWISGSQGDDLRSGFITRQVYEDFCVTWSIERQQYSAMGFSDDEAVKWDAIKLGYLCSLLERRFISYNKDSEETNRLIKDIGNDALFNNLNTDDIRKKVSKHIRISSALIQSGKLGILYTYWRICDSLRRHKYGK